MERVDKEIDNADQALYREAASDVLHTILSCNS